MTTSINQENIQSFIAYLFLKRKGKEASAELLNSWSQIPNEEIFVHLTKMTQQWGWSSDQLLEEIDNYLHTSFLTKPPAESIQLNFEPIKPPKIIEPTKPPKFKEPASYPTPIENLPTKKKNTWLYLFVFIGLAAAAFIFYKFNEYNNLQRLYSTTDNIAIRTENGSTIGRMDVFAKEDAITSLREADNKIYNITSENGKTLETRKLLKDDAGFIDYLMQNADKMVYVSKNFLTNSEDYSTLQKTIFSEISKYHYEMTNLKSDVRKVIIGSLALDQNLSNLYIKNACANNSGNYTSILKHQMKDKKTMIVICKMSNNIFYKLQGIPDENLFYAPQILQLRNPTEGNLVNFESQDVLFRYSDGYYRVYSCNKEDTSVYAVTDSNGDITYLTYDVELDYDSYDTTSYSGGNNPF